MPDDSKTPPKRRRISTLEERLERAKLVEAKAATRMRLKTQKVQQYEAQARRRKRKLDTRRKIIVGALALKHMEFDGIYATALKGLIDEYVTRDQDRALFDLEPLPDNDQRRANPPLVY